MTGAASLYTCSTCKHSDLRMLLQITWWFHEPFPAVKHRLLRRGLDSLYQKPLWWHQSRMLSIKNEEQRPGEPWACGLTAPHRVRPRTQLSSHVGNTGEPCSLLTQGGAFTHVSKTSKTSSELLILGRVTWGRQQPWELRGVGKPHQTVSQAHTSRWSAWTPTSLTNKWVFKNVSWGGGHWNSTHCVCRKNSAKTLWQKGAPEESFTLKPSRNRKFCAITQLYKYLGF